MIFSSHVFLTCLGSLSDVTDDLFGGSKNGVVAAFGDFNADKLTDIFVLVDSGRSVVCFPVSLPVPLSLSLSLTHFLFLFNSIP